MASVQDVLRKMKQVQISEASDYAGLAVDDYSFYYGYEFNRAGQDEVWGFEYSKDDKTVFAIEYDEMKKYKDCPDKFETTQCLLFGIGIFLSLKGGENNG